ncbi:hypothetical protein [Helicobacter felis]|uniref:hypothetical protein n=1 Tax=Helicobacter felis TaxID=214 RepID=UPI001F1A6ED9|nr:hypothetical protein [Helicobacter felis]
MPFLLWMGLLFLPLLANPIREMQILYEQAHPPSLHVFLTKENPQRQQILHSPKCYYPHLKTIQGKYPYRVRHARSDAPI